MTRPLVMSEEGEFSKRLVTANITHTWWFNMPPLRTKAFSKHVDALADTHTLAGGHGATPGAVAGARPGDRRAAAHHHVTRLARERHVVAHGDVVAEAQPIGWDTRLAAGDHWGEGGRERERRVGEKFSVGMKEAAAVAVCVRSSWKQKVHKLGSGGGGR